MADSQTYAIFILVAISAIIEAWNFYEQTKAIKKIFGEFFWFNPTEKKSARHANGQLSEKEVQRKFYVRYAYTLWKRFMSLSTPNGNIFSSVLDLTTNNDVWHFSSSYFSTSLASNDTMLLRHVLCVEYS